MRLRARRAHRPHGRRGVPQRRRGHRGGPGGRPGPRRDGRGARRAAGRQRARRVGGRPLLHLHLVAGRGPGRRPGGHPERGLRDHGGRARAQAAGARAGHRAPDRHPAAGQPDARAPARECPGMDLASGFRPAGDGHEIGGDFYDVFRVGDDCWMVVVGDVCGKGAEAAAITALARYTLRAAAIRDGAEPVHAARPAQRGDAAPARRHALRVGGVRVPRAAGGRRRHDAACAWPATCRRCGWAPTARSPASRAATARCWASGTSPTCEQERVELAPGRAAGALHGRRAGRRSRAASSPRRRSPTCSAGPRRARRPRTRSSLIEREVVQGGALRGATTWRCWSSAPDELASGLTLEGIPRRTACSSS